MDTKVIPTCIRNLAHFPADEPSANLEQVEALRPDVTLFLE